jgi:catechol 2,3-dioxygenase-like lactoylglutathione lyase family enzyme
MDIRSANTILYCNNWRTTVAFYQEKLLLKPTLVREWFVEFELNGKSRLSVADASHTSFKSCEGKGLTLSFEVDDLTEIHGQLQKAELNPEPIRKHPWGARVIYINDPEGNRIEFWTSDP